MRKTQKKAISYICRPKTAVSRRVQADFTLERSATYLRTSRSIYYIHSRNQIYLILQFKRGCRSTTQKVMIWALSQYEPLGNRRPILQKMVWQVYSIVNKNYIQMSRSFRIKYDIQSLQTKNNPLFTNIKVYLVSEGTKRFISEAKQLANNHAYFKDSIEQNHKTLNINTTTGNYSQAKVSFVFEFESEERYIKMGETSVDVADIINNNKIGQLSGYKLEKCYDRNAKVWISIDFSLNQHKRLNKSAEIKQKQDNFHVMSQHNLPQTKGRVKSIYETNRDYTQLSMLQNLAFKEDLSMVSQNKTSYNPTRTHFQRYTTGKTDVNKKSIQKGSDVQKLQEDLAAATINLRLIQQQLMAVQQKYLKNSKLLEQTEQKLKSSLKQNTRINEKCENLQKKLNTFQKNFQSHKQAQNNQAEKYLKMYQESQIERNKLLLEVESERQQLKQKVKEVQKKSAENLKKAKNAEKHEQLLKDDIKCCMAQIANYERQYKQQKKLRLEADQKLKQAMIQIDKLIEVLQKTKLEISNLQRQKAQLNEQIQISKLTIDEISKEKNQLRQESAKKQEILQNYDIELKKVNETIKSQRMRYSRQLQQMQQNTEREQKHFEKYIEELETKTINDYNKSNEASQLKRQISRLKRFLAQEKGRNNLFQQEIQKLNNQNQIFEQKVIQLQHQILEIQKEKGELQGNLIQLRIMQQEQNCSQKSEDQKVSFQRQTQQLAEKCYMERDEYWRKEFEKLEGDTKMMMQRYRKQKDSLSNRLKIGQKQLSEKQKQLQKAQLRIIQLEDSQNKQTRQIKDLMAKILSFQTILEENQYKLSMQESKIAQLTKAKVQLQELEAALTEADKKLAYKTKQLFSLKVQLEKQKETKNKQRTQVKEMVTFICNLLVLPQKNQSFYEQLRFQHIQAETLLQLNSALKFYAEKHNRIRFRIDKSQYLEAGFNQKQKKTLKNTQPVKFPRRLSTNQKNSNQSQLREDEQLYTSSRLIESKIIGISQKKEENEVILSLLRQQCAQVKSRLQRQKTRTIQLEKQLQKLHENIEEERRNHSKTKELLESKVEELEVSEEKYDKTRKNIESAKEQINRLSLQLENTKMQFQSYQKTYKLDRAQSRKNSSSSKTLLLPKSQEDTFYKTLELQKKLKQSQEEVQKLKKQKEEKRKDEGPYNKQIKNLELKLKQSDASINNLKKQLQQQKKSTDQQKEIYNIRLKKMKQNYQQEIGNHIKQKTQLKQNLQASQSKLKQLTRQIKNLEQNLKKMNTQLSNIAEKDQRNKKMLMSQWELKMKTLQTQHENDLTVMKRQMQDQRTFQKSLKETIQKKEKQIKELKDQIDKKGKEIQNLIGQCQIYGIRIKSLEQEEDLYKQTIGVLEKKIFEPSESSKKNVEREVQNSDLRSNFSLKTYTFR